MGRPFRGVQRCSKAGSIIGVQMERTPLREPHFYPEGGDFTGFRSWPVDRDGSMVRPLPKRWYERALTRIFSFILGV